MIALLSEKSNRVVLTPQICKKIKSQLEVPIIMERGAGQSASYSDEAYEEYVDFQDREKILATADIVPTISPMSVEDMAKLKKQCNLVSMFEPYNDKEITDTLKGMDLNAYSLDMIPRSTLAQSVDILSSMASLAGYKAAILGSAELSRCIPMMMTAAGTIRPSSFLILGAGVAGLQAIATAKRLGGIVSAFDVRSSSKEEVESLGAKFVEVEGAADSSAAGGYAVEQTEDFIKRQKQKVHEVALKSDVIITTAQIRGKKAPILIEDRTIKEMKAGSVIIDLAIKTGGNTSFTKLGKSVTDRGIVIIGDSDLADTIPQHSSDLLASNMFNFLKLLIKDKQIAHDPENEILSSSLITKS